jgi:hypothetical protein
VGRPRDLLKAAQSFSSYRGDTVIRVEPS